MLYWPLEVNYRHTSEIVRVWFQTTAIKQVSKKVSIAIKQSALIYGMPVVHSLELRWVCYLDLMGEKTASVRSSELPKVMQIVKGGGEIQTQIYLMLFSGHCNPPDTK